jgi:hypothetical protein
MRENREQLEELLRRFYDEDQASQTASEIEAAEAYLDAESPLPRPEVLNRIQQSLRQRAAILSRKKRFYRRLLTAAAACLILAAGLLMQTLRQSHVLPPVAFGPQNKLIQDFFTDDAVAEISSKLDDITEQVYDDSASDKNNSWETEVDSEINEMTLIAQADFWKG